MPAALPDRADTVSGTPVTIAVLGNDAGTGLAIVGVTQPANGSVAATSPNGLTYTPTPGFAGEDSFAYTVRDAVGDTASAVVTVTVRAANGSGTPLANADGAVTTAGKAVVIPVLANDVDPEGGRLRLVGIDSPSHGTIEVLADQSIRYVPQLGFVGIDYFSYTTADDDGDTAMGTVAVNVLMPNLPPAANDDVVVVDLDTPTVIDMLANDVDPDGDAIELGALTMPQHGGLVVNPDRSVTYTPTSGYLGPDSFTYRIVDDRGAVATGEVRLNVQRSNSDPVAGMDSVTTETGTPVVIDILANDNDPEGDPLVLSALTLPRHGTLALGLDQRLLYTPSRGFVGQDAFTYQVKDDTTGRGTGEVLITVTPSTSQAFYPNGYAYRRRLVIPDQAAEGTAEGFVFLVAEEGPWLKSVSNGGRVESAGGHDLRFEFADGTRVVHDVERYDPAGGRLIAWIRVPAWRFAERLDLFLYYGNPTRTTAEGDAGAVWQDYLVAWDARTGVDRSGRGRGLTPVNVKTDGVIGKGGLYDGTAIASAPDAAWLAGHEAITVQAFVRPDTAAIGTDKGIISQGPLTGDDADLGFSLRFDAAGFFGRATNTVLWQVKTSGGDARVEGAANAQRLGTMQLHGVWRSGEPPRLFVDGRISTASNTPEVRSGVTATTAGPLSLGVAAKDGPGGGWVGGIDDVRLRASALPPAWITIEHANYADPKGFYGLGTEEQVGDTYPAPVALPVTVEMASGGRVDIDVLAKVFLAAPPGGLRLVGVGQPAQGAASIIDAKIRYTGLTGFVGEDDFAYTVTDGFKTATGTIRVRSLDQVVSSPKTDAGLYVPLLGLSAIEVADDAAFEAALRRFRVGASSPLSTASHRLVVTGPLGQKHVIAGIDPINGLPLVVEGAHGDLRKVASEGPQISGEIEAQSPVWLHAVRIDNGRADTSASGKAAAPYRVRLAPGSGGSKITHSYLRGQQIVGSGHPAVSGADAVPDVTIAFVHFFTGTENRDSADHVEVCIKNTSNQVFPHRWTFYRNFFEKKAGAMYSEDMNIYLAHGYGFAPYGTRRVVEDWRIEENMSEGQSHRSVYYLKHAGPGCVIRRNVHNTYNPSGYGAGGAILRGNGTYGVLVEGEKVIKLGEFNVQGRDHRIQGCDFGGTKVNLNCTGVEPSVNKGSEGANGLVMWGCTGGSFVLGTKLSRDDFVADLDDVLFEGVTPLGWKDINGAAFGFDGTGTGTGTHPQVRSAGIRRLGATSRPLAAVSTIARADVGPGAG